MSSNLLAKYKLHQNVHVKCMSESMLFSVYLASYLYNRPFVLYLIQNPYTYIQLHLLCLKNRNMEYIY